jgi:hypothetical protein
MKYGIKGHYGHDEREKQTNKTIQHLYKITNVITFMNNYATNSEANL